MEETLGKRIVRNRKRLGLTQDALAEKLGVTAQAVSKWENDQSCPDITTLPRLAEIFGITTDSLLGLQTPAKEAELIAEDTPGLDIENKNGQWEFKWNSGRNVNLSIGIWIISTGLMLLGANLLDQQVSLWTALWTTGLTVFGILGLRPKFSFFRLGCALTGGYFMINELWPRLFVLEKSYILIIFLLLFGLSLLVSTGKNGKKPGFYITTHGKDRLVCDYEVSDDSFGCELSFGSGTQLVELPLLRWGEASVSFGELTLDLRGCREFASGCHLDLECSFGSLTVLVPSSLRVEPSQSGAFGNISVLGAPAPDAAAVLLVSADASFGEITLRYL